MAKVVLDQNARQARPGRPILYVLVVSLVLLAIAGIGFSIWGKATAPATPPQNTSQPSAGTSGGQPSPPKP